MQYFKQNVLDKNKKCYHKISAMKAIEDTYGRRYSYLRISLIDRCNLFCSYCFSNVSNSDKTSLLKLQDIVNIVSVLSGFGIKKVRFTGGEPLLRNDIVDIVKKIKNINGIEKLCLTTNGILLKNMVKELKVAGIDSINVSIDSLDEERFERITGSKKLKDVISGIHTAIKYGINLKINVVTLNDLTLQEVDKFINFASENSITVRFIELMPVYGHNNIKNSFSPIKHIENYVKNKFKILDYYYEGVSRVYKLNKCKIGFITPLSNPFCGKCNRLRISSKGIMYRCLFDKSRLDLKSFIIEGKYDEMYFKIKEFLSGKKETHNLNDKERLDNILPVMRAIGG